MAARAFALHEATAARLFALTIVSIVLLAPASALGHTPSATMPTRDAHRWRLDPTFSGDGLAETFFTKGSNDAAWAHDMAVQPDGGIVVAGTAGGDTVPATSAPGRGAETVERGLDV